MRRLLPLLLVALAACAPAGSGSAQGLDAAEMPEVITVTSPDFAAGEQIPERFSCEGQDVSPELVWTGVPPGAVEVAVVVDDPDAPTGIYVHWVIFGLDPALSGLEEGQVPDGALQAQNSAGSVAYKGPCPPGDSSHRYRFTVYALDEPLGLPDGIGVGEALDGIRDRALARGRLEARFER